MGTKRERQQLHRRWVIACLATLGWAFGVFCPAAPAAEAPPDPPIVGAEADQLLRDMAAYLRAADTFTFHAEITYDDPLPSGQKLQYGAEMEVAVHRPNRLHAKYTGDLGGKRFWCDGKTITLLDTTEVVYSTAAAPSTLQEALDFAVERYDLTIPLADFVYPDLYETLREKVRYGFHAGMATVDSVRCHHLAFVEQFVEWKIWIEDGPWLVPRKIVITYKTLPGSPQYTAWLSEWNFGLRLPDRMFVARVPTGAEQVVFVETPQNNPTD